ncbi:MAG: hypothetical protein AB7F32_10920 [Victivallaceae bacterium]
MSGSGWMFWCRAAWCLALLGLGSGCVRDTAMYGVSNEVIEAGLWNDFSSRACNVTSCLRLSPGCWDDDHDIRGVAWTGATRMQRLDGVAISLVRTAVEGGGSGAMLAAANRVEGEFNGVQMGGVNARQRGAGVSLGGVNDYSRRNRSKMTGVQLGAVNFCGDSARIFQLGLVNFADESANAVQFGIWNDNGVFGTPFLNFVFGWTPENPPSVPERQVTSCRRDYPEIEQATRIADSTRSEAEIRRVLAEKNYYPAELETILEVYSNEDCRIHLPYRFNPAIVSILREYLAAPPPESGGPDCGQVSTTPR